MPWRRHPGGVTLELLLDASLPAEGYRLHVEHSGIRLVAAGESGWVWGLQTLRQLAGTPVVPPGPGRLELDCVTIEDAPQLGWRGVLLDVSRHFIPLADLFGLVEVMSAHKLNRLHLHLTDNQGWRFQSYRYPELTRAGAWREETRFPGHESGDGTPHGGYYTQDQLRALVAHARSLGVVIVPEVDMPGHLAAAITACPDLAVPGVEPATVMLGAGHSPHLLRLDKPGLDFSTGIWEEVLDVFDSPWVHIGGDEVDPDQWVESPEMRKLAQERGLERAEELLGWFVAHLKDWLVARGRVPLGWDEVTDSAHGEGMTALVWRHPDKGPDLASRGYDVVLSPYQRYYLDYYASTSPEEPVSIGGMVPSQKVWEFDPFSGFGGDLRDRLLGIQASLWTEYIASMREVEYMLWPRAAVVADRAWSGPDRSGPTGESWDEFAARLAHHMRRLDASGLNLRPDDGPLPWQAGGSGRRRRPGVGREFLDLDPRNDVDDNHSSGLTPEEWRSQN